MSTTHDPNVPPVAPVPDPNLPSAAPADDPDQLRLQIEHTREELGGTVAALAEKADVKAQASAKADEIKEKVHEVEATAKVKATEATEKAKENPVPLAIAAAVLLLLLNRIRKRRKARRRQASIVEKSLQNALTGGTPVAAVLVDRHQAPAA